MPKTGYLSRSLWTMEAVITMRAVPQGLHARASGRHETSPISPQRRRLPTACLCVVRRLWSLRLLKHLACRRLPGPQNPRAHLNGRSDPQVLRLSENTYTHVQRYDIYIYRLVDICTYVYEHIYVGGNLLTFFPTAEHPVRLSFPGCLPATPLLQGRR